MSRGIGGSARVIMQDENTVVYEYYAYNLNEEEYRNRDHIYDGIFTTLSQQKTDNLDDYRSFVYPLRKQWHIITLTSCFIYDSVIY